MSASSSNTVSRHIRSTVMRTMLRKFRVEGVASRALPAFGIKPTELGQALIRIALLDDSRTSRALMKLMLSFASVHKHGLHAQMMNLKIDALHDLSKGSSLDLGPVAAIQHLAAGMLLCCIEVRTSCLWLLMHHSCA